jgi:hypothetical protein
MRSIGASLVKAELFLIVIALICVVGAAIALIVQYTQPGSTTAVNSEQQEPASRPVSRPLPAGPRAFQP